LADLLNYKNEQVPPEENVFFTMKRCPAPFNKALPAFGITLDGSQVTFSNPIRFCDSSTANKCRGKNVFCFNPEDLGNLDDTFKDKRIEITPKDAVQPVSSDAFVYPRLSDPLSLLVYGPRMGTSCTTRQRSVQKFIRDVVHRGALAPPDGKSSLSMCAPEMTKLLTTGDTEKLQEAVLRFVPESFCRDPIQDFDCGPEGNDPCPYNREKPKLCAQYENKPLAKVSSDPVALVQTITIRGLEATTENALAYQIMDQVIIDEEKGTALLKADPGRAWLQSKISVSKAFVASACSATGKTSIKREMVLKLKAKAPKVWSALLPRHVHVVCGDATDRRRHRHRRLAAAAAAAAAAAVVAANNHRSLSSTTTELSILVQVPGDENKADAIRSIATVCNSKETMAEVLTDAGVRDDANEPPKASAIVSAKASGETTETFTIPASELSKALKGQVESARADQKADEEDADKDQEEDEDKGSGLTDAMIAGIAIGCVALIAIVAGVAVLVFRKNRSLSSFSSQTNNNSSKGQPGGLVSLPNPAAGLEMADSKPERVIVTATDPTTVVMVAASPPAAVQPVGYQNGVPYYMNANGETTWTPPKIL
jgi:hypothetical protein